MNKIINHTQLSCIVEWEVRSAPRVIKSVINIQEKNGKADVHIKTYKTYIQIRRTYKLSAQIIITKQ